MKILLIVIGLILSPFVAWAGHSAKHPQERPDYAGEGYRVPGGYQLPPIYRPSQPGDSLLRDPWQRNRSGESLLAPPSVYDLRSPHTRPDRQLLDEE